MVAVITEGERHGATPGRAVDENRLACRTGFARADCRRSRKGHRHDAQAGRAARFIDPRSRPPTLRMNIVIDAASPEDATAAASLVFLFPVTAGEWPSEEGGRWLRPAVSGDSVGLGRSTSVCCSIGSAASSGLTATSPTGSPCSSSPPARTSPTWPTRTELHLRRRPSPASLFARSPSPPSAAFLLCECLVMPGCRGRQASSPRRRRHLLAGELDRRRHRQRREFAVAAPQAMSPPSRACRLRLRASAAGRPRRTGGRRALAARQGARRAGITWSAVPPTPDPLHPLPTSPSSAGKILGEQPLGAWTSPSTSTVTWCLRSRAL